MKDDTLSLAHDVMDWFKENGYEDEIDDDEITRVYEWLKVSDTSGKDVATLAVEYELQMF